MSIQYNTSTAVYDSNTFTYTGGLTSASQNLPVLGVFIAFTSNAYEANPNWVEVTQYVRQVSLNRGRSDELEQFQGGKATVVLDNRTRIFDPFNTQSPYYSPAVVQRVNTCVNPSFETDLSDWLEISGTTISRTSAHSFVGNWSMLATSTSALNATGARVFVTGSPNIPFPPITAGQTVTLSCYVKNVSGATRNHQLAVRGLSAGGGSLEVFTSSQVSVVAGGDWQRLSLTATFTNASVTQYSFEVRYQATGAAIGNATAIDAVLTETTSTLQSYFDGNTAGCVWNGVQNSSSSTLLPVPAFTNLKPRKQIKIVAQWAGVQYQMFRGFVSGFPVEWTESGKDTVTVVDCFDLMSFMGAENISADWVVAYMQQLGAQSIVKNDVKENTYITDDTDNVTQYSTQPNYGTAGGSNIMAETLTFKPAPTGSGNISVAESVMGLGSPTGLAATSDGLTFIELVRLITSNANNAYSTVFWVKVDSSIVGLGSNNGIADLMMIDFASVGVVSVGVAYNQTIATNIGSVILTLRLGVSTFYVTTNLSINDSQPHCIAVTWNGSNWNVFVDGKNVNTTGFTTAGFQFPVKVDFVPIGTDQTINFGYGAWFDRALTTDEIVRLANLGSNTFVEPSDDRFTRLYESTSLPTALLDVDPTFNFFDVQALPNEGSPLLPALQQVANSEGSVMFVDGAGVLHFWSRNTIFADTESAVSQVTFADDGTGFPYANKSLSVMLDGDQIRNDVTILDSFDRPSTVRNQASIVENGTAAETFNTLLVDVDSAQELAQRIVNIFAEPDIDLEPFTLHGQYDPSQWADLLSLELLHRFTFKRTPPVGSAIVKQMLVQQLSWDMTPSTWECTIKGSARFTGWFTVGRSLVGGSDVVL